MKYENPFKIEGNWYKGNLHAHTTNSDGALEPQELADHYRENGYDFLCITDHGKVTDVSDLSDNDFLAIRGAELGGGRSELGQIYHLAAIGLTEMIETDGDDDVQEIIDAVREKGGEVLVAHPYWSALTFKDILPLEGILGIEVFNTTCFVSIAKGHSATHWDDLLIRGKKTLGFATDDVHWHFNDHRPKDACGAWIMVKAPALNAEDVLNAIRRGHFYASNGPRIDDLTIADGKISVRTSNATVISFVADASRGESFTAKEGELITHAEYAIGGGEKYIRVESFDAEGKTAWCNPTFFNHE